jgi:tetratricopeptide (TPR) repeat protein
MRFAASVAFLLSVFALNSPGESLLDSANALYGAGDIKGALRLYHRALDNGDSPALAAFNLGNVYYQMDSLHLSIRFYTDCIVRAPEFGRAYQNVAAAYFGLDDFGACIGAAVRAVELDPANTRTWLLLGTAYRKLKAYPQAFETFLRLMEMAPTLEEPYIALAEISRDLEDDETAIHWLERFPAEGENAAFASLMLGDIFKKQKNYSQAMYHIRKAWETDPANNWAFFEIISLHLLMGNDLLALQEARNGLAQYPDFADLAVLAGNIAFKHERYDEAAYLYTQARDNGNPEGVVGLENIRVTRRYAAENP